VTCSTESRYFAILFIVLYVLQNDDIPQKWNGKFFSDSSLLELGALHQLGHNISDPCPLPSGPVNLTVLDLSGVHVIRVTYCFCEAAGMNARLNPGARRCQLLRSCLFPATLIRPGTAFTFRLLDFLHKLQTQSKVNLYNFYLSLVSVTNSTDQKPPVVRSLVSSSYPFL